MIRGKYTHSRKWIGLGLLAIAACDVSHNSGGSSQSGDPVVPDFPIAYVQRPLPIDEDGAPGTRDILDPTAFYPGAQLVVKDRASAGARERIISDRAFAGEDDARAFYDVKDLAVSADGRRLVFAMRAPEIPNSDIQPTWNLWEYDLDTDSLERLIPSDTIAEAGHDVNPQYLADGRVLFSSTRVERTRAILIDELQSQFAPLDDKRNEESFALHIYDRHRNRFEQISFNVSQDLQPIQRQNGDLVFVRRDGINNHNRFSLYRSKADGSQLEPLYGYHSQTTGTEGSRAVISRPQELPDGRLLAVLTPWQTEQLGGDIIVVDDERFIDIDQPTRAYMGLSEPGQRSLTGNRIDIRGELPSEGGFFNSAYPLFDGSDRLLVSWSQCRLLDPETERLAPCTQTLLDAGAEMAPLLYGLWIFNPQNFTQLPVKVPNEGVLYTDAVVMAPRPRAFDWRPQDLDTTLVEGNLAVLHIRSVYDIDGQDNAPGGIAAVSDPSRTQYRQRQRRFLRIVKNISIPSREVRDFNNNAFGRSAAQGMRTILGYVPLEPDGSAKFTVPADVPIMIDVVDARGKRVGARHQNWLHLRPGEQRQCTGCHTATSPNPHGRLDAEADSANPGAIGGMPFPNTRLVDAFGTPEGLPEFGESMAEYYARIRGPRTPSVDLLFQDEWTNLGEPLPPIAMRYIDILTNINNNPRDAQCAPLDTPPDIWRAPTECVTPGIWNSQCRIIIDYLTHIAPLWQADRRACNGAQELVTDLTCVSCHTTRGEDGLQVPEGQLELTGEVSAVNNNFVTSYHQLFFPRNQRELVDGVLQEVRVPTGRFETDANGELILDPETGLPIEITAPVPMPIPLSTGGAAASNRFFSRFEAGGSHAGYLSDAELKLLAEWLDIGGQYYNNPFNAPAN